jgi:hypothetical protein
VRYDVCGRLREFRQFEYEGSQHNRPVFRFCARIAMPFIDDDIVALRPDTGNPVQLFWGEEVKILSQDANSIRVGVVGRGTPPLEGRISTKAKLRNKALLQISMIDVQQGDGLILQSPGGKVIFIDGGDNQLFARHAAARFPGTSEENPLKVDLMLVTHGDADHFDGLNELRKSETNPKQGKRIFVAPRRYYHNGIAKRPGKMNDRDLKDVEMLGTTEKMGSETFITGLVENPAQLPAGQLNEPFKKWMATLAAWESRSQAAWGQPIERRRLDQTRGNAFDFLTEEDIQVDLYGPITQDVNGKPGLRFLATPPDDANLMLGTKPAGRGSGLSASHTINGHSIAFRLRFGNVRFLFTGDLNQEAGERLRKALPGASLRCEILKAPHHGSADFDMEFLKEAGPVVSLISSGDENAQKEYIHPRATLMSALGKASRTTPGVIFCTELAAFFQTLGYVDVPDERRPGRTRRVFAFERTNFGIIHIRTDGERVLAFTHSGKEGMNEAYRFNVSPNGDVTFAAEVSKVSAPKKT